MRKRHKKRLNADGSCSEPPALSRSAFTESLLHTFFRNVCIQGFFPDVRRLAFLQKADKQGSEHPPEHCARKVADYIRRIDIPERKPLYRRNCQLQQFCRRSENRTRSQRVFPRCFLSYQRD